MATDLNLLKSATTDILDLSGKAAEDTANAQAQTAVAGGNTTEAGLYGSAIQIAQSNAGLEDIAGNIQDIQEQRKATATIGKQLAAGAGNGFAASGSSVALLRQSLQQSYLAQQLNDVQTQITKGGFLEQATAAQSEQAAAQAAATSATALGTAYTNASNVATANAANETAALEKLMTLDIQQNGPLTPEQQATQDVVTSVLKSPLNGAAALPESAFPSATNTGGGTGPGSLGSFTGFAPGPPLRGPTGSSGGGINVATVG